MIVQLTKEEIEKQKCLIISNYEKDIFAFWNYIKHSNFDDKTKKELTDKFKIYGVNDYVRRTTVSSK